MVTSYKGIITKEVKEAKQPLMTVGDYMSKKLVTFKPEQTMHEVVKILLKKGISGAPVVNEKNELVGVISEGDCLKEVVKGKYDNMPTLSGLAKDQMTKNVVTIEPQLNIFEAADLFLNRRIRRFPVVKNGKLVGQISQKDIMRAVMKLKGG
jgi:CBS domain-containing protein